MPSTTAALRSGGLLGPKGLGQKVDKGVDFFHSQVGCHCTKSSTSRLSDSSEDGGDRSGYGHERVELRDKVVATGWLVRISIICTKPKLERSEVLGIKFPIFQSTSYPQLYGLLHPIFVENALDESINRLLA